MRAVTKREDFLMILWNPRRNQAERSRNARAPELSDEPRHVAEEKEDEAS